MVRSLSRTVAIFIGALLLCSAAVSTGVAHSEHGHPVKIHQGSCDELGAVAYTLTGVGAEVDQDGKAVDPGSAVNEDTSYQVLKSTTTLSTSIDQLLAEPLSIMVYESDENLEGIACGNLGGLRLSSDQGEELAVGLAEVNVPGHTGLAVFEATPENPGLVEVGIYIGHAMSPVSAGGSGESSHSGDHHHAEGTPTT